MHRVQKDLFNTYTKIVKDFKIFNELSEDVLEVSINFFNLIFTNLGPIVKRLI